MLQILDYTRGKNYAVFSFALLMPRLVPALLSNIRLG